MPRAQPLALISTSPFLAEPQRKPPPLLRTVAPKHSEAFGLFVRYVDLRKDFPHAAVSTLARCLGVTPPVLRRAMSYGALPTSVLTIVANRPAAFSLAAIRALGTLGAADPASAEAMALQVLRGERKSTQLVRQLRHQAPSPALPVGHGIRIGLAAWRLNNPERAELLVRAVTRLQSLPYANTLSIVTQPTPERIEVTLPPQHGLDPSGRALVALALKLLRRI